MPVSIEEFMKDFTPKERAEVASRTATLVEEELARLGSRQIPDVDVAAVSDEVTKLR